MIIFIVSIVAISLFIAWMARQGEIKLIHRAYFAVAAVTTIWILGIIAIKFTDPSNMTMLYVWDSMTYIGGASVQVFALYITLIFTKGLEKFPRKYFVLLIWPFLANIFVWTNPWHHLFYRQFGVQLSQIEFGPLLYINGVYQFSCLVISVALMVAFAVRNRTRLYLQQAILFSLGSMIPLLVNLLALAKVMDVSIAATPMAFIFSIICNGLAIYRLHLLDIRPIAMRHVLNQISDCYLITGSDGLIIGYNEPFMDVIGLQNGIKENGHLQDCLKDEDVEYKTAIYNLLTSIESCRNMGSSISYEQAISHQEADGWRKLYYIVEINPLLVGEDIGGFVAIFKDVSKLRESMQRLQDSQVRLMDQERLASLGQMVGGLAHNLKTPIMSIAGSAAVLNNLVEEASISIGDQEVNEDDYREIYGEMRDWLQKVRDACSYMSDIITAVKGQAGNMDASEFVDFSLGDAIKRVSLLLRHELQGGRCKLITEVTIDNLSDREIYIHGDINNLVQVINNLVSNAVYAQIPDGNHNIVIRVDKDEENLYLHVIDWGCGIKQEVKNRLFRQMITSKGNKGTGLGVYISHAVIRGKFGGD
ncbi:MAG: PAS domain S-box protein, partial [Clostridia bacterium]|nr:PAS domain S-box protein [Clostridia bacterium]